MENIKNLLTNKKIIIVSHDIGGANIIKNYIEHYSINARYYLRGPALSIFKKKKQYNLISNIKKSEVVITGTGWKTDLEYKAIKYAKKFNKICITFLDSWTDYKKRFIRNKIICLPNIICVFDKTSKSYVTSLIKKKVKILIIKNFYFKNFLTEAKKYKKKSDNILYLSSTYDNALKKKIDLNLLKKFLVKIAKIEAYKNLNIDIKVHPTENVNKYIKFKKKYLKIKKVFKDKKLENIILKYKIAAGTETSALVLAALCKLKTINNIVGTSIKQKIPREYFTKSI